MGSKIVSGFFVLLGVALVVFSAWGAVTIGPGAAHAVGAGFGLVFVGLGVASLRQKGPKATPDQRFLAWLRDHEREVLEGTALYQNVRITPETRLLRYAYVLSAVVVTLRRPSRLYIEGVERTGLVNVTYTLATLLLGWWGIPWGPIYTVGTLYSNLARRDVVRVGDVLHSFSAEEEAKPDLDR